MRYLVIILSFLFASPILLIGQKVEIEGVIIDAQTGEPISFAHVAIKGSSIGSISNENGGFILPEIQNPATDTLLVSHVSYKTAFFPVATFTNGRIIELTPLVINGAEITVVDISDHTTIETSVNNLLAQGIDTKLLKGFYRKTAKIDSSYLQAIEAFYLVEYGSYDFEDGERKFLGLQNKVLSEGRVAEVVASSKNIGQTNLPRTDFSTFEATFNMKNYQQYLAFPVALSENSALLALPLSLDYYKFYTGERVALLGDSIGVYLFKPRVYKGIKRLFFKQKEQKVDSAYAYINLNTNQLVRHQGWFSTIPGLAEGSEVSGLNLSYDYRFRKNGLPESVSLISFSPKMTYQDKWGKVYQIANVEIKSTMVFYDYEENYDSRIFAFNSTFMSVKDDSKPLINSTYKPRFWEENQWLKRTPADEAFVTFMQRNGLFRVNK